jgi:hypothetical protein
MSERIHALALELFGKPTIEACTLDEIQNLAVKYPYFAPAHFLLAQKLKELNDPGYSKQLQKAVLYYNDPVQFEWFINSERFYTDSEEIIERAKIPSNESLLPGKEEMVEHHAPIEDIVEVNPAPFSSLLSEVEIEEEEEEPSVPQREIFEEGKPKEEIVEETEETIPQPVNKQESLTGLNQEVSTEHENKEEDSLETVETDAELPGLNLAQKLPGLEELKQKQEPPEDALAFEPFHTVDYFASQGIKPSTEEVPKDKFGQQLKSFTAWLKTMKRLPAAEVPKSSNVVGETTVVNMAHSSITDQEILTEAMAEVWLKQGNKEKAIEIYNKLGLFDPSKKAFFAAKIDNLKPS